MDFLDLSLAPDSAATLTDQIVAGIQGRIDDRVLRPGMRLPPIRTLAASLKVSRFTVVEAYDRLVARGYVHSRPGSGFYVLGPAASGAARPAESEGDSAFSRALDNAGVMRSALADDPSHLKIGGGWLPAGWQDDMGLARQIRALTARDNPRLTAYGTPHGYLPLRQQLGLILAERGFAAEPEQIVLTHGATQALDIVVRYFLRPGDCVLVDDPGYWNFFASLRLQGVQLVGVPRTREGPDIAALEELLTHHRPKLFVTQSVLHNPTSVNIGAGVAHRLLQLAARHDFLIVEDDVYADFQPGPALRLAALDRLERVIYVGSYAKTLSANLRVGFLAARRDIAAACVDVKLFTSVATSEFAEQLVYELLLGGHYRKFLARLHGRLAASMGHALELLERHGFETYSEPRAGMFAWVRHRAIDDSTELVRRAADFAITFSSGHLFRPQLQASPWLRINVAYTDDPRFAAFLAALPR